MAEIGLMVHIHIRNLSIMEWNTKNLCIKNKFGHFHIESNSKTNNKGLLISNFGSIHINGEEKRTFNGLKDTKYLHKLRFGSKGLNRKIKKEYNGLVQALMKFYKNLIWLNNHKLDSCNPDIHYFYSDEKEKGLWKKFDTNKTVSACLKISSQEFFNKTLDNIFEFDAPRHFELLVESENLKEKSPISSLVLSISALEIALRFFLNKKFGSLNIEMTPLRALLNPTLELFNIFDYLKLPEKHLNLINEGIYIRNSYLHKGEKPQKLDNKIDKYISSISNVISLLESTIYEIKSSSVPLELLELNESCQDIRGLNMDH